MKRPLCLLLLALTATGVACSPPSADDLVQQVIGQRNNYEAVLSSWINQEEPAPPHLYLEVNVVNNNQDVTLKTLTVLVEQLDVDGKLLSSQRVAIDVAALTPGIAQSIGVQVSPVAPGVDGCRVTVERQPDREDWSKFPELDAVRPRI